MIWGLAGTEDFCDPEIERAVVVQERNTGWRTTWAARYRRVFPRAPDAPDLRTPEVAKRWDEVMEPRRQAAKAWIEARLTERHQIRAERSFAWLSNERRSRDFITPDDLTRAAEFLAQRHRSHSTRGTSNAQSMD